MDGIGVIGICASAALALAILALMVAIPWVKDLDERVKKLEQENEKTN